MNNYYVYIHYRLSDNKPFYVGKGKDGRAFDLKGKARNEYWHKVNNKHGCRVEIIFDELTEEEAFQVEIDVIKELKYFGYKLTNATNGGDGPNGMMFSDQQRLNIAMGLKSKRYKDKIRKEKQVIRQKSSGANNRNSDNNLYCFVRLSDWYEIICSRHELNKMFNVNMDLLKKLFYKTNPRKSADGWKLKDFKNERYSKKTESEKKAV